MKKQLKEIEILFGEKDSELCGWEYTIPEGMEATIFDNKIVVKKKKSEDERMRKELIRAFKSLNTIKVWNGIERTDILAWLEKQGEKKPEENKGNIGEISPNWSEEDEHRIKDTIYFLDTAKKHYASTVELDACIDWLKSLKQRIGG